MGVRLMVKNIPVSHRPIKRRNEPNELTEINNYPFPTSWSPLFVNTMKITLLHSRNPTCRTDNLDGRSISK